jgi:hypothetical protein
MIVTEKLFTSLLLPLIPVYYGTLDVQNITTTPSFIKASDFKTPKALAEYLLFLDANPSEYDKYHLWRKAERPFTEEYMQTLQNRVAGPREILMHDKALPNFGWWLKARTAQCCRLCDRNFVEKAARSKKPESFISTTFLRADIKEVFYNGKFRR